VISRGDFKHKPEACQSFICNRLLQFRPGVFPIFLLAITDLERQSGFVQNKICYMNPHLSWDGVWFPNWAEVLARVRLQELERRAYYRAIVEYLRFCKQSRQRATVASARRFMEQVQQRQRLGVLQMATWKEGLNWFFNASKQTNHALTQPGTDPYLSQNPHPQPLSHPMGEGGARSGGAPGGKMLKAENRKGEQGASNIEHRTSNLEHLTSPRPSPLLSGAEREKNPGADTQLPKHCAREKEPPLAARDLGGPGWERDLIRVLRERHYEWRTEQAYRMWARRFARWLEGRKHGFDTSPSIPLPDRGGEGSLIEAAGELEVRGFLSELAVRQRVAVATQRQAFSPREITDYVNLLLRVCFALN
jgi:hypothetical protein